MSAAHPDGALERLRALLGHIRSTDSYYAARLRDVGVDEHVASIEEFTTRVPFTTKAELAQDQAAHPPYGSLLTEPLETYTRLHQTSSTTGQPLRWADTTDSWHAMLDGWIEVFRAAEMTADDRILVAFSFGPFIGLWMAFDAAARMGCLTIPGGAMNSVTRLRVLEMNRCTVLCCTPTYAIRLGEVAREEGIDLSTSSVRAIVVGGEPGASVPATRVHLEQLWPTARLFDHYGMTEVGPVTYQCTARTDAVHVIEDALLCEVIDRETGEPLPADADAPGELVITTLARTACPVLRYRTGDLVRPLPRSTCACGRTTLQFDHGIIGRADDMIVVRGVNLFPSAVDQVVRSVDGIAEYRVEIDTSSALTEVEVLIEPDASCADAEALTQTLARAFRDTYNLRIPVTAVPAGDLPRFELKSRRWIKRSSTTP